MTVKELVEKIQTTFKALPEKVSSLATWKKALIIGCACLIFLGANDLGFYMLGTKTCKQTAPTEIKPSERPKEKTTLIVKPKEKAVQCGDRIELTAAMENNKKIKVTGKDQCKMTVKYFDLDYHCPLIKNQLSFGLGFIGVYDNIGKKFTPLIGGIAGYTRWFGNVGFGPQIKAYGAIDKSMYSAGADLVVNYRW